MDIFTQLVLVIGRIHSDGVVNMLGTGFIISNDGKIATSRHVVADNDENLVVLFPNMKIINKYQDTTKNICTPVQASILESDPFRDITIIKADLNFSGTIPILGGFDEMSVGEQVSIVGFPHCVEGRRVLTFQQAGIGAKVLLESQGIKSKHAVINTQTRPGQVSSVSSIIGSQLGVSGAILSPIIVIYLYLAGKMGVKAYCTGLTFE